jgi:uncharacterized protein
MAEMPTAWILENGELRYEADGVTIGLYPVPANPAAICPAPLALAPSQFCLFEWTDYRLKVSAPSGVQVHCGAVSLEQDRDGFFAIGYQNQLGRSTIVVGLPGRRAVELPVEILSPVKYPAPAQYQAFFSALLDDLAVQSPRLPFTVAAPTGAGVIESAAPSSPLFALNFFCQQSEMFRMALGLILAEPHRQLVQQERWSPLAEAAEVDQDTLIDVLMHPGRLTPAPASTWPIARRLHQQVPIRVLQFIKEETGDTPENRFVRMVLRAFQQALADLPHQAFWPNVSLAQKSILRETEGLITEALLDPLFEEVGDLAVFPAASAVLRRRDGYRELAELWRLFLLARRPFFGALQKAIDLRDVAQLYEFWCFFRLIGDLTPVFGQPPAGRIVISDAEGLEFEASVAWAQQARLVYNRRHGAPHSYSTALNPDFVLLRPDAKPVIFDAKFRFTVDDWAEADDIPTRDVKRTDLYKMHTYRDALGAQAAVVLYPGNRPVFYDLQARRLREAVDLSTALSHGGVGALCLEPGMEESRATI